MCRPTSRAVTGPANVGVRFVHTEEDVVTYTA